jgi:hypothetical protein
MSDLDLSLPRIVGEYYRSRDGKVIHLAPCSWMGRAVRWPYAAGRSLHEVVAVVADVEHLRLCRRCWPAGALGEQS